MSGSVVEEESRGLTSGVASLGVSSSREATGSEASFAGSVGGAQSWRLQHKECYLQSS